MHKVRPWLRHPVLYSVAFLSIGVVLLFAGLCSYAILETKLYVTALQKFDIATAQSHAKRALPVASFFSVITAQRNSDIEAWKIALTLHQELSAVSLVAQQFSASLAGSKEPVSISELQTPLMTLQQKLEKLSQRLDNGYLAPRILPSRYTKQLTIASSALKDFIPFLDTLTTGKQSWVIIFQNSDELRATGGFPGSYAFINFSEGKLAEIVVEDIYDADGQFTGYVEAPAGIREYTSSSRGLRLPDANWYPHYPKSAETMLQFFALGNKRMIAGITSINLSVGKTILSATGPLSLPDYNTTVTADNLNTVLRQSRDEFFPGSVQKKHILNQTITLARQKMAELPADQQLSLISNLLKRFSSKDIQVFAVNPQLQEILTKYGVTGSIGQGTLTKNLTNLPCEPSRCSPTIFSLVESNVGINKANPYIERAITLSSHSPQSVNVTISYHNTAAKESKTLLTPVVADSEKPFSTLATNGYANYQRLLISDYFKLKKVTIQGVTEQKIDAEEVAYESSGRLNQYGFLVVVLPESSVTVELELESSETTFDRLSHPLLLVKQSGIQPTLYTVTTHTPAISFPLEQDTLVGWE